jgi:CIC family chloride channel protein
MSEPGTSQPQAGQPPPRTTEAQRFLLLSVLLGISAGLLVVCFHIAIDWITWWAEDVASTWWRRTLVTGLGAGAATALVAYAFRDSAGSGIVHTKSALYVSDGYIPPKAIPGKFITSSLSLGTGTPLGPEDPALLMGAGVASMLGRAFGLGRRARRLIAPVGAAAAIAAAFNTPITGVLFVIEEVVAAWNAAVLGSIVLAAVAAVVVARWFLGDDVLFRVPAFTLSDPRELLVYAVLGLVGGLLAVLYVRGMVGLRHRFSRLKRWTRPAQAIVAGLAIGVAGWWVPEVLGPGYGAVDSALHGQFPWSTLFLLGLTKLVVTTVAFGSGTPGGLFAPTLFIGAMVGGGIGALAQEYVPFPMSPASAYVLAGMGTFFAAAFRAPMTSIFMVFELSATYVIIVPVMVASTVSYLVARQLQRLPLFDALAVEEGIVLPSVLEQRETEPLRVEQAMQPAGTVADASRPVAEALALVDQGAAAVGVWMDGAGWALFGRDTLRGLDANLATRSLRDTLVLSPLPVVYPDETLDAALRRLGSRPHLPVVDRSDEDRLLGVVGLADIHRVYGIATAPSAASASTSSTV